MFVYPIAPEQDAKELKRCFVLGSLRIQLLDPTAYANRSIPGYYA